MCCDLGHQCWSKRARKPSGVLTACNTCLCSPAVFAVALLTPVSCRHNANASSAALLGTHNLCCATPFRRDLCSNISLDCCQGSLLLDRAPTLPARCRPILGQVIGRVLLCDAFVRSVARYCRPGLAERSREKSVIQTSWLRLRTKSSVRFSGTPDLDPTSSHPATAVACHHAYINALARDCKRIMRSRTESPDIA